MKTVLLIILVSMQMLLGQETLVRGKVTYISAGTVYVSAGRGSGVVDSTLFCVVGGTDTLAVLKVFAVSSKSAACIVVSSKREPAIGDNVVGVATPWEHTRISTGLPKDTTRSHLSADETYRGLRSNETPPAINVQGRASLQYFTSQAENSGYSLNQPGLVLSLRGVARDLPLKVEMYGNLRMLSRGGSNPLSSSASNESRIYKLSVEYDDNTNTVTLGRILPQYAPSVGSIDGASFSRRLGSFVTGVSLGFQPNPKQQGISTDTRKIALFGQFQTREPLDLTVTAAYARSYLLSQLDREAISLLVNGFTLGGFSFYGYSDVDLRTKIDDRFDLSPVLSTAVLGMNYRITDLLSVGLGGDASRPIYQYSSVQLLADSLLDRKLRTGVNLSVTLSFGNGMGFMNTFTPRTLGGPLSDDYNNYSAFWISNPFSSGVTVRMSANVSSNPITSTLGYGLNIQRNVFGLDVSGRYQRSQFTIVQLDTRNNGETFGIDAAMLVTNKLSLIVSFDAMRGFGSNTNTLFTELSWRF